MSATEDMPPVVLTWRAWIAHTQGCAECRPDGPCDTAAILWQAYKDTGRDAPSTAPGRPA